MQPTTLANGNTMDTIPCQWCRAISLDPAFKKAWMRRGIVRHSRGKYAGSVADFNEALLLDPYDKHAKKLRGHSAAKEREVLLRALAFSILHFLVRGRQADTKQICRPALPTGAKPAPNCCCLNRLGPVVNSLLDCLFKPLHEIPR